jgi:hypothetical protein
MKKNNCRFSIKHFWLIFLIIPVAGSFLFSCTKLNSPYIIPKTGHVIDTIMDWDTIVPVKKVLLEDYTGHKCVNCPEATLIAHNLEALYDGRLIVMAVHAGIFAEPSATGDFTADYTSPAGDTWNSVFGITSNPNGLVNRKDFGSGGVTVLGKDLWSESVSQLINLSPDAFIVIDNDFEPDSRLMSYSVYTKFVNPLKGTYKLTLCVVEDSLRSPQKNNNSAVGTTPTIYDYLFMNVLRGSINGPWGDLLTTSMNASHTYLDKFSYTLSAAWNPKHCWLYAIVYKDETKEIIQVDRKKVVN